MFVVISVPCVPLVGLHAVGRGFIMTALGKVVSSIQEEVQLAAKIILVYITILTTSFDARRHLMQRQISSLAVISDEQAILT